MNSYICYSLSFCSLKCIDLHALTVLCLLSPNRSEQYKEQRDSDSSSDGMIRKVDETMDAAETLHVMKKRCVFNTICNT